MPKAPGNHFCLLNPAGKLPMMPERIGHWNQVESSYNLAAMLIVNCLLNSTRNSVYKLGHNMWRNFGQIHVDTLHKFVQPFCDKISPHFNCQLFGKLRRRWLPAKNPSKIATSRMNNTRRRWLAWSSAKILSKIAPIVTEFQSKISRWVDFSV